MYNFIDVSEVSEGTLLPSEALMINGEYIENQINGYRTLSVTGREALSPDVESSMVGNRDGSYLKKKRYPERILVVKYQIKAGSNEEFREAYNRLGQILDVEDVELIFNDEQDKFYIGTPCMINEVKGGTNIVTGTFEILCTDPFKYSVVEYEAVPWENDKNNLLIDYNGTYKAYPVLEAEFYQKSEEDAALPEDGDCGYVAYFNEKGKIIQIGDPDEVDGNDAYARSQILVNHLFSSEQGWNSARASWYLNEGMDIPSQMTGEQIETNGAIGIKAASYTTPSAPKDQSAVILNAVSRANTPAITYRITAKTSARTENAVRVDFAITASLSTSNNYFGNGYILIVSIYINEKWHDLTIKNKNDYWRGNTGHTVNLSVNIAGLKAEDAWLKNVKFKASRSDKLGTAGILGETACSNIPMSVYEKSVPESYYLGATDYGSGNGWHGVSVVHTLVKDATGEVGAGSFTFSYGQQMAIGSAFKAQEQIGGFHAYLLSDAKIVCGICLVKNTVGKNGKLMIFVNDTKVDQIDIDLSYSNPYSNGVTSVIKNGNKLTVSVGAYKKVYADDQIKDLKVKKIVFAFDKWANKTELSKNGITYVKFVKDNCTTWLDIPNKFSQNDIVKADCGEGKIYLNGTEIPELGALGNDWEDFCLIPGLNRIGFSYSDWVKEPYAPTPKIRYREVFL